MTITNYSDATNCAFSVCYTRGMRVIYIDSLFFLNLLADYLLLLTAARLSAIALKRPRYLIAALFGAVYAVMSVVEGFYFLGGAVFRLAAAAVMGLIAYGEEAHPISCTAVFLAVSAAFGGAIYALGLESIDIGILAGSFAVCYAVLTAISLIRAKLPTRKTANIRLRFLDRECEFDALIDSGNCLTDPVSGAAVIVAGSEAMRVLLHEQSALLEIDDPVEFISAADSFPELRGRFRLLPYSALGGGGLLPVFRPEALYIDGRKKSGVLCAVSTHLHGTQGITGL